MTAGPSIAARQRPTGVATRRSPSSTLRRALLTLMLGALVASLLVGCSGSENDSNPPTDREIASLLARQGAAVRHHDRSAFLSDIDPEPAAASFRIDQDAELANLRLLPLRVWTYRAGPAVTLTSAERSARAKFGPTARIVRVTLHYALRGVDPVATEHDLWWTFTRVDGRVVVAADDGLANAGGVSWQGPWDFGPMAVVHGRASLVLGEADQTPLLHEVSADLDAAVPIVSSVWGRDWTRDVAAIVPATPQGLAAALNSTGPGAGSAGAGSTSGGTTGGGTTGAGSTTGGDVVAVAVSDGQNPLTGRVQGQRVVVEPGTFGRLSALGRRITITHEVTHIASAADTGDASPRWLVEGLAEYVANLHTGQAPRTAAAELVARIRSAGLPAALPDDAEFDDPGSSAVAYEQAWLACRLIARRVGAAGLVRLYRQVGTSTLSSGAAVSHAAHSVLHESTSRFVAQWRVYLQATLR